jgi:dTDP-glucose 4,6-dehydratase
MFPKLYNILRNYSIRIEIPIRYNGFGSIKMTKNILITGGCGFIGSNFIHFLLTNHPDVSITNYDALTYAGNEDNLADISADPRYFFVHGDIRDTDQLKSLFSKRQFDAVIHFAAESHVDRSIENPAEFILTNVVGTDNLLNISLDQWKRSDASLRANFRFLHISTDEVFGSLAEGDAPFTETTPYAPNSPYAASKAASDHLVRAYYQTYGFPAIISNCSNNYGPFQFPEKLIPLMVLNGLEGQPLPIYGDGLQIRDWLYVEDHCAALIAVLKKGKPGQSYNIGGNNQPTNLDITRQICEILDNLIAGSPKNSHEKLITFVKDRPGHDRRYAMDTTKIRSEIGWQPKYDLNTGLNKTVHWYLENKAWVENIKKRPAYNEWIEQNYAGREKIS